MSEINRVTLFNIPKEEDQATVLEQFKRLQQGALKDGMPYIKSVKAGRLIEDARSQSYTVMLQVVFACIKDLRYFDNECSFHSEVKKIVGPRMKPPPLVGYFTDQLREL